MCPFEVHLIGFVVCILLRFLFVVLFFPHAHSSFLILFISLATSFCNFSLMDTVNVTVKISVFDVCERGGGEEGSCYIIHACAFIQGGPLKGGDFVMALVNRDNKATRAIEARWEWLEAGAVAGVTGATSFCVKELFTGKPLGANVGGIVLNVSAHDIAMLRLSPGSSC